LAVWPKGVGIFDSASDNFLETLASLLSQWAFALLAGCLGFAFLFLALRSIPSRIRDKRLFWLVELAVLPLVVTFAAAVPIALFDLAEPNIWHGRVEEVKGVLQALVFAYLANRALTLFVWQGALRRYADTLPGIVRNLCAFFIYLVAVYAILAYVFEQPVTGLLVSSGIALGVLGLAFQSTLTDIITGIAMTIERPFGVGDWVEFEAGICGKVESIDWRATRLRTISNTTHVIPNNKIAIGIGRNFSRGSETPASRGRHRVTRDS
jgi:small-conductance mechanosensitive channel